MNKWCFCSWIIKMLDRLLHEVFPFLLNWNSWNYLKNFTSCKTSKVRNITWEDPLRKTPLKIDPFNFIVTLHSISIILSDVDTLRFYLHFFNFSWRKYLCKHVGNNFVCNIKVYNYNCLLPCNWISLVVSSCLVMNFLSVFL